MENPFQYLTKDRQLHLKRARLKQSESQLERSRLRSAYQEKILEKRGFDDLVIDVLDQLQRAVYPGLSLRSNDQNWSIGRWYKSPDGSVRWDSVFVIQLVYDELSGDALCFECLRSPRKVRAELSRQGLSDAVQRLYTVHGDKDASSDRPPRKDSYDALVAQAFADLQKKIDLELHLLSDDKKWVIGAWKLQDEALEWWGLLEIRLIYNWRKQVKAFRCLAKKQATRVELDPARLSDELFALYSSVSEG